MVNIKMHGTKNINFDKSLVSDTRTQCSQQLVRIKLLSLIYVHSVANIV